MSSDMLQIAASGVRAARAALDLTSQNIANAGTEGYVRRSIRLSEVALGAGYGRVGESSLSGVRVDGVSRNADAFRQAEVRRTGSDAARGAVSVAALENAEAVLDHAQLFPALVGFENTVTQLAVDPVDPSLRAAALEQARVVASSFGLAAGGLDAVANGLRSDAAGAVDQINQLAGQLGQINLRLARAQPGGADQAALLDRRDAALKTLSGLADTATDFAANGSVSVRIGGAAAPLLVSGTSVDRLMMATATDGTISFVLASGGAMSPVGGSLTGTAQSLIMVRDRRADLDVLANGLMTTANAAQAAGVALDGTAGQPLFAGTGAAGIALALTSGTQLATAPAGSPAGSRDPANLTALRAALAGADLSGQLNTVLAGLSSAAQASRTTSEALDAIAGAAKQALDSQAGVSLDDEAVNLVRYQQAFQASGKAIQIASDLFDSLLAIR